MWGGAPAASISIAITMKLLGAQYLTVGEHRALLAASGFVEIAIDTERRKGWISCVGRKPQD